MLLAIDTSTRYAGVALYDGGHILSIRSWHSTSSHTSELMPAVKGVLEERGITPRDLEGIAVALGPGAFSAPPGGHQRRQGSRAGCGKTPGWSSHPGPGSSSLPGVRLARLCPAGSGTKRGGRRVFQSPRGTHRRGHDGAARGRLVWSRGADDLLRRRDFQVARLH